MCITRFFNCRMPAVHVRMMLSLTLCFFLAASSLVSPLYAAGKYCMRFWPVSFPHLLIIFKNSVALKMRENKRIWEMWHAASSSAEDFQLPLCQPINHMVSLEKEGCPTCHLVETSICSGHCVTKVLWVAQGGGSAWGHCVDGGG